MITDRLFNAANKLNNYNVIIGDIDLVKETILSVEVSYKNNTPVVLGKIIINDLYDLSMLQKWRDVGVQISYIDIFEVEVSKVFTILSVTEQYDDQFKKVFVIELQDIFSYTLEHSYLSKSFNVDLTTALNTYLTRLGIDALDNLTLNLTSVGSVYPFAVPKNMSNLQFFLMEFYKHGFTFYQDKSNVYVRSLTDLDPTGLPSNGLFLNETDNQLYKNKIIDIISSLNNRVNILPKTRSLAYDFNTKSMLKDDTNDPTLYSLNTDSFNLQGTDGERDVYQQHSDFGQHKLMMKDSFMDQSDIEIIVNGYAKNDLNQIYELRLKGNVSSSDSQSKGNLVMNGYYISTEVTDKIVGDTMVQKIALNRADLTSIA